MKKRNLLTGIVLLACAALACNVSPPQPQNLPIVNSQDEVPRISVEDAKAALDSGQAVIVDVRSAQSYAASHVAGAVSIPLTNIDSEVNNLPLDKDRWIITYCT